MATYTHLFWWDPSLVSADNPTGAQLWCSSATPDEHGRGWCDHLDRVCWAGVEPPEGRPE